MAELSLSFDMSDFDRHIPFVKEKVRVAKMKSLGVIADEILRLSQREVPFVTGELMNSGSSQPNGDDEWVVGYNKVYAAYMHEGLWADGTHVIKNYSNNRKGKYLEDPIKINREILIAYFAESMKKLTGIL